MTATFLKDPADSSDFGRDWTPQLDDGETITNATWFIEDDDLTLTIDADRSGLAGNIATVWLNAGDVGRDYTVTCRITTSTGRQLERSIEIICVDR